MVNHMNPKPDGLPRYVMVTPARNEEKNLDRTIRSMVSQTVRPVKWIIVNDGSTDSTPDIISRFSSEHPWIQRLDMPQHRDRSFAAKAHCFNAAWKNLETLEYEVIGNLDADTSFEPDYLAFLMKQFADDSALGVAGTPFREESGYDSSSDSFEGQNHVAGGCQLFRRQCFEEVGGYVPNRAGGVDWIAVTSARMKGWKTRSFREKWYMHHRSLGTAERSLVSALYSYGQKDYYLGGGLTWEVFRVGFRLWKRPLILGGLALAFGYTSAAVRRIPRPVSPQLMKFHRAEQIKKLKTILSTLLRMKKVDSFSVYTRNGA